MMDANSSTTKLNKHITSGFSISTISSFRSIEAWYIEHAIKIIISLTKEQHESYENTKDCYICKEKFENKYLKDQKYFEIRNHCHYTQEYRGGANIICNSKYSVPRKILIGFHNGSNYNYHFIIRELAEEFKKQFTCSG